MVASRNRSAKHPVLQRNLNAPLFLDGAHPPWGGADLYLSRVCPAWLAMPKVFNVRVVYRGLVYFFSTIETSGFLLSTSGQWFWQC